MQPTKPLWLSLIRQLADGHDSNPGAAPAGARSEAGTGDKWSLFVAPEGEPGLLYSLNPTATDVYVYEAPQHAVSLPNANSTWSMYTMRTVSAAEANTVHEVVSRQSIPTGPLQPGSAHGGRAFGAFVSASQLWVEGIVRELVEERVLEHQVLRYVRSMMGPSRLAHFKHQDQDQE
ncbi:uncharacterized protein DSM5745_10365 [Aspergillus mulundensis]|uniref:Uncharacterized protein n=1 Tax=Aspergillus mulundensis TaxID=1810919 RepID=A0A3D8QIN9_9EURO|nr:hypothetical protein DSM5745_10365 [Aspergillus mulundensis]RDW61693.1 hypothetical protein DSM5745_10365 [Aspergillus mulundensis]